MIFFRFLARVDDDVDVPDWGWCHCPWTVVIPSITSSNHYCPDPRRLRNSVKSVINYKVKSLTIQPKFYYLSQVIEIGVSYFLLIYQISYSERNHRKELITFGGRLIVIL